MLAKGARNGAGVSSQETTPGGHVFDVLIESSARAPRRTGWSLASTAAHLSVIAITVALTLKAPPSPQTERAIEVISWRPPAPQAPSIGDLLRGPPIIRDIPIIVEIPTVPIVQSNVGDVATVDLPGMAGADPLRDVLPRTPIVDDRVYQEGAVERLVVPRADNPPPEYPSALRSAMVEGSVLVQFVVDTTGRVEHTSIAIVKATHDQFAFAVRRWLARTRYTPAQIKGKPVRQLVQQEVAFTLDR